MKTRGRRAPNGRADVKDERRARALCVCQPILLANCLECDRRRMLIGQEVVCLSYCEHPRLAAAAGRQSGERPLSELIASIHVPANVVIHPTRRQINFTE